MSWIEVKETVLLEENDRDSESCIEKMGNWEAIAIWYDYDGPPWGNDDPIWMEAWAGTSRKRNRRTRIIHRFRRYFDIGDEYIDLTLDPDEYAADMELKAQDACMSDF